MSLTGSDQSFNVAERFLDGQDGRRTALLTQDGPTSYDELRAQVNRAGNALRALGAGRGDRVLIALRDGVEYVATWFAAQRIGAVTVEVYNFLGTGDYRYYLDYLKPKVVVADVGTAPKLREAGAREIVVVGAEPGELAPGEHHFETLVAKLPPVLDAVHVDGDDEAIWKLTSGSTGKPKACRLTARSPWLSFQWYARMALGIREDDVVLPVPKLFFGYARDLVALFPLGVGGTGILFPERSTADTIFDLVERYRPTILVNVPTMMKAMLEHPGAGGKDLSSLRFVTSAGEHLPPDLHRRWLDTFGVEVIDGIGSSEAYHGYITNRPGESRVGTLGKVVPGYRARVVDDGGKALPDGEVGVLEVSGEPVALGYYRSPEKSAATFPAEHTVRSGDLFTRDEDGYFHYRGRADDLLKVGGVWVAPVEIENCLATHPAVEACAVVGYEDGGLTRSRAYVVVSDPVEAAELQRYVRERLAPYKYPRDIRFVDALPETPSGKVDRGRLRDAA
ncbi:benzoate-CoA ligase family protein [Amycolatopsis roodepoortensis]|uniref:benzoate-CoA ligase family protein n=1 Tax=Amycolatopsis roodepoortensis TaxID=700274 RepID=UPI00214BDA29|nr:benzoate-CoA ligase family protein [Amycolatopsis roodepoortensis]UUV29031.1 benzoate-CoA ligase family protein [Amycolatopsis roodepoortensis]